MYTRYHGTLQLAVAIGTVVFAGTIDAAPEPVREGPDRAEARSPTRMQSATIRADTMVRFADHTPIPRYPELLRNQRVGGRAIVQVVVDTNGLALAGSLKLLSASHNEFAQAVRDNMTAARFVAARVGGRNVRQLVQVVYYFRVEGVGPGQFLAMPPEPSRVHTLQITVTAVSP